MITLLNTCRAEREGTAQAQNGPNHCVGVMIYGLSEVLTTPSHFHGCEMGLMIVRHEGWGGGLGHVERYNNGGAGMSIPIELFFGYGLMAVICERCGKAVATPGSRLCPNCEENPVKAPSGSRDEPEDDA